MRQCGGGSCGRKELDMRDGGDTVKNTALSINDTCANACVGYNKHETRIETKGRVSKHACYVV